MASRYGVGLHTSYRCESQVAEIISQSKHVQSTCRKGNPGQTQACSVNAAKAIMSVAADIASWSKLPCLV